MDYNLASGPFVRIPQTINDPDRFKDPSPPSERSAGSLATRDAALRAFTPPPARTTIPDYNVPKGKWDDGNINELARIFLRDYFKMLGSGKFLGFVPELKDQKSDRQYAEMFNPTTGETHFLQTRRHALVDFMRRELERVRSVLRPGKEAEFRAMKGALINHSIRLLCENPRDLTIFLLTNRIFDGIGEKYPPADVFPLKVLKSGGKPISILNGKLVTVLKVSDLEGVLRKSLRDGVLYPMFAYFEVMVRGRYEESLAKPGKGLYPSSWCSPKGLSREDLVAAREGFYVGSGQFNTHLPVMDVLPETRIKAFYVDRAKAKAKPTAEAVVAGIRQAIRICSKYAHFTNSDLMTGPDGKQVVKQSAMEAKMGKRLKDPHWLIFRANPPEGAELPRDYSKSFVAIYLPELYSNFPEVRVPKDTSEQVDYQMRAMVAEALLDPSISQVLFIIEAAHYLAFNRGSFINPLNINAQRALSLVSGELTREKQKELLIGMFDPGKSGTKSPLCIYREQFKKV